MNGVNGIRLKQEYAKAIESFSAGIERGAQGSKKTLYQRAKCYGELKEYGRALQDCEAALRLDPKHEKASKLKASLLPLTKTEE